MYSLYPGTNDKLTGKLFRKNDNSSYDGLCELIGNGELKSDLESIRVFQREQIAQYFQVPWKIARQSAENICFRRMMKLLKDAIVLNETEVENNFEMKECIRVMLRLAQLGGQFDNNGKSKQAFATLIEKL